MKLNPENCRNFNNSFNLDDITFYKKDDDML